MGINRRHFLSLGAAGAATMFLPALQRGKGGRFFSNSARAAAGATGPLLITLEAHAAWDATFLVDPHVDAAFTPWTNADLRTVAGTSLKYAPNLLADGTKTPYVVPTSIGSTSTVDFFTKHGSKLVVVNGVDNATVSHDVGPRVAFTGSNREGLPSLVGMFAAARGATLPLSLMTTGGFVNTEGLIPITRAGSVSVLQGLARSNVANFTAQPANQRKYEDDSVFSLVRDRVRQRDARRAAAASVPRAIQGVLNVEATRTQDVFTNFDALSSAFDAASSVQSQNPVIPQAAACMAAMSAGACVAAHLITSESFDTHQQHDLDHPVSMQNLLEILDFVLDRAASDPNIAARGLMVVVGSDFGRTKYNNDDPAGKDHWPVTSMMVAAVGPAASLIQGGRVVGQTTTKVNGATAGGLISKTVKTTPDGGDLQVSGSPSDVALTAGHVHLAVRDALGLSSDDPTAARFRLTAVVPQTSLPILKPR